MGLFSGEKMTLMLEKYDYKPGDVIKGTVTLRLKKPMHARKLDVGLIGRKIEHQGGGIRIGSGGTKHTSSTNYQTVYDFHIPLGSEQDYLEGSFPFEIRVPVDILQTQGPQLEGKAAAAVNVLKALGGVSSRIEWIVIARLDLPMKMDVSASQKILLS